MSIRRETRDRLEEMAEAGYAAFSSALVPGAQAMLGVRLPLLRKLAAEIARGDWRAYLAEGEDRYFEETMLRGMIIGRARGPLSEMLSLAADFVPRIDNWSVCDSFCAGFAHAKRCPEAVWDFLLPYLRDERTYYARFGAVMLLDHFVDRAHLERVLALLDAIRARDYYASMAVAWAVSVCYVKFPQRTRDYLHNCRLDDATYNRAIQKIVESRRVDGADKAGLRAMKRRATKGGE